MPRKRQRKRAAQDLNNRELVPVQQQASLDRRQLQRQRQQERERQQHQQQQELQQQLRQQHEERQQQLRQRQRERQQQLYQQQRERQQQQYQRQERQHLDTEWQPGIWIHLETGEVEPCAFRWINETLWIRLLIPRRILTRPDWTEELQPEWPRRNCPDRIRRPEPEPEPVWTKHAGAIFVFFILAVVVAYLASKTWLQ